MEIPLKQNEDMMVIKIGGSVITRKKDGVPEVNEKNLNRITGEIADALAEKELRLFITHGAGPFGHVFAKKYNLHLGLSDESQIVGIGITHRWMQLLNYHVVKALQDAGVKAMPFQPSAGGIMADRKLVQFPLNVVERFMDMGLVVVSHGDVLLDNRTGIGILSGDHLAPYVAYNLRASRLVLGTDVNGVYSKDPNKYPDAKHIPLVTPNNINEVIEDLGGSTGTDVTGGMARKVMELLELAKKGIESEIISIETPKNMYRTLMGETGLGTTIKGE